MFEKPTHLNLPDIETTKRKLFSCEADLKRRDSELARNSNVSILKAKYGKEKLVAKKLAFKVRNIFWVIVTLIRNVWKF